MISLIECRQNEIALLCQQNKVQRLSLFGSATTDKFNMQSSDLDFVVSFKTQEPREYTNCYFRLADSLEHLFERDVDLVTERSIRNPYFRQIIERTSQVVYES